MSEPDMNLASGIAAFEAKEFAKAFQFLSPLAETGNAQAQYRLAIMYQNGLGHVRNDMMAFKWMRSAAEQGDALAQHGLGFMYMQGECVPKNEKLAAEWFRRAAEQGLWVHCLGQHLVAAMRQEPPGAREVGPWKPVDLVQPILRVEAVPLDQGQVADQPVVVLRVRENLLGRLGQRRAADLLGREG